MAPWPFSDKEVNASGRPSSTVSPSSSSRVRQDPAPVDGFRLLRSLGDSALGRSASYESVGAWGAASLIGSAGLTGAVTVLLRSRTKAERDLPRGTHARAAAISRVASPCLPTSQYALAQRKRSAAMCRRRALTGLSLPLAASRVLHAAVAPRRSSHASASSVHKT